MIDFLGSWESLVLREEEEGLWSGVVREEEASVSLSAMARNPWETAGELYGRRRPMGGSSGPPAAAAVVVVSVTAGSFRRALSSGLRKVPILHNNAYSGNQ